MINSIHERQDERDLFHLKIYNQIKNLLQIENMSGVEILSSMSRIIQVVDRLDSYHADDRQTITGPRFRLMLHLFLKEQVGNEAGLTPTELSQFQQVSKNTTSALLRGLEEQGYIERELDPNDLRVFRIRLSDSGRRLMLEMTPVRIEGMNQLVSCLSEQEIDQLTQLLTKLRHSIEDQVCLSQKK